jgi:hypothetical protein
MANAVLTSLVAALLQQVPGGHNMPLAPYLLVAGSYEFLEKVLIAKSVDTTKDV